LHALGARALLLVAEPTARRERDRAVWLQSLCGRVDALAPVAALDLYDGRKRFRWFSGTIPGKPTSTEGDCAAAP
jgi:hypothetical protein